MDSCVHLLFICLSLYSPWYFNMYMVSFLSPWVYRLRNLLYYILKWKTEYHFVKKSKILYSRIWIWDYLKWHTNWFLLIFCELKSLESLKWKKNILWCSQSNESITAKVDLEPCLSAWLTCFWFLDCQPGYCS